MAGETLGVAVISLFGLLFIARLVGPHSAGITYLLFCSPRAAACHEPCRKREKPFSAL
jgi:hypothetical protein